MHQKLALLTLYGKANDKDRAILGAIGQQQQPQLESRFCIDIDIANYALKCIAGDGDVHNYNQKEQPKLDKAETNDEESSVNHNTSCCQLNSVFI